MDTALTWNHTGRHFATQATAPHMNGGRRWPRMQLLQSQSQKYRCLPWPAVGISKRTPIGLRQSCLLAQERYLVVAVSI